MCKPIEVLMSLRVNEYAAVLDVWQNKPRATQKKILTVKLSQVENKCFIFLYL